MAIFSSRFSYQDRVVIDGDETLVAVVTGLTWTFEECHTVKLSWVHNGDVKVAWVEEWRLTKKE